MKNVIVSEKCHLTVKNIVYTIFTVNDIFIGGKLPFVDYRFMSLIEVTSTLIWKLPSPLLYQNTIVIPVTDPVPRYVTID